MSMLSWLKRRRLDLDEEDFQDERGTSMSEHEADA
jgi:hypothetical protein